MKILMITDRKGSAIDRLANMVKEYNKHFDIQILPIHPKRPSEEILKSYQTLIKRANIIDYEYWKTAKMLIERYGLPKDKKTILTHNNEANLFDIDNKQFNQIIVRNSYQHSQIPDAHRINLAVDLNKFKFVKELTDKPVIGYVGRIGKWKGVMEIAKVCKEKGWYFLVVGSIASKEYFDNIPKDRMIFKENVSDDELVAYYSQMLCYCCNSDDGMESGTLPILEAMASGIPVLTRKVGIVRDIGQNNTNMYIRRGKKKDIKDLEDNLERIVDYPKVHEQLRENAWRSVREYSAEKMAREYSKLFYRLISDRPLVSVIVPTHNRLENVKVILGDLNNNRYENYEVIIADDFSDDGTGEFIEQNRYNYRFPIKYINTLNDSYGLAQARNMAAIEAEGDYLLFLDDRLSLYNDAIDSFIRKAKIIEKEIKKDFRPTATKFWLFGNKGDMKQTFVENFSFIKRQDFINAGMFCERCNLYGSLSQETRTRFYRQGFSLVFIPEAEAREITSSSSKSKKDEVYKSKLMLYKMGM